MSFTTKHEVLQYEKNRGFEALKKVADVVASRDRKSCVLQVLKEVDTETLLYFHCAVVAINNLGDGVQLALAMRDPKEVLDTYARLKVARDHRYHSVDPTWDGSWSEGDY